MMNKRAMDIAESRAALLMVLGGVLGMLFLVWRTGFTMAEMDWDCDGHTSLHELSEAIDVRRIVVDRAGEQCQEYFDLRDDSPIRTDCPSHPCVDHSRDALLP